MNNEIPDDLIHAAFFFIDIVGLSNPILSTETQRTKIRILNESIYDCKTFQLASKEEVFVLPTGDGMLIGFKDGLEQPIKLAIELQEKLKKYNKNAPTTEKIATRIGCNVGHIFVVKDVYGNMNLWGPGAILARRVMDLGDENHILLTSEMVDDLIEFSEDYQKILHPISNYKIKHNEEILVYSAYTDEFGNKERPAKTLKPNESIKKSELNKSICEKIIFNINLKEFKEKNVIQHERIYDFLNNTSEPVYEVHIGILTNTETEVGELNVKAYDEEEDELTISKIISSGFSKIIVIKLPRPIFKGSNGRQVRIKYNKTEAASFFENKFLTGSASIEVNFIVPEDFTRNANLFLIYGKDKKNIEISNQISEQKNRIIHWEVNEKINPDDRIRLEWPKESI